VSERSELNESIIENYRVVWRAMDRAMLPRLIEIGLTMPQFKALIAVSTSSPSGISVTELGHELCVGQPSASLIVDQLVRPGYVVRVTDESDRRRVLVKATPEGTEIVAELRHGRRESFRTMLNKLGDEDAETLLEGMRAFARSIEVGPTGSVSAY
jgi:DNA-binding MarR family transcriptional regulator